MQDLCFCNSKPMLLRGKTYAFASPKLCFYFLVILLSPFYRFYFTALLCLYRCLAAFMLRLDCFYFQSLLLYFTVLFNSQLSNKTIAAMASTMGTARGTTHESCRPRAVNVVG